MGRTEQVTIATGIQKQRMPNNDLSLFDKLKGGKIMEFVKYNGKIKVLR